MRFALLLCLTALAQLHAVEIVAHRGASEDAPENTVASFNLGWKQQADADELDTYLTKDGECIVIHDANTKRTTGVDGKVAELTLSELRAMDAGSFKGPQWKGEKLPTLAEALATIPDGKCLFIEVKCGPEILPALEKVMTASGKKPEQLAIISFNYDVVKQAKERLPKSPVYLLAGLKKKKDSNEPPAAPSVDELIAKAKAANLDGLDLDYRFAIASEIVAKIKAAGMKLYIWTIDDAEVARKAVAAGVDGITTNRPAWLRAQVE
jgi:glycerophosphoryl diester phosphodiesterase